MAGSAKARGVQAHWGGPFLHHFILTSMCDCIGPQTTWYSCLKASYCDSCMYRILSIYMDTPNWFRSKQLIIAYFYLTNILQLEDKVRWSYWIQAWNSSDTYKQVCEKLKFWSSKITSCVYSIQSHIVCTGFLPRHSFLPLKEKIPGRCKISVFS